MKYLVLLFSVILFAACDGEADTDKVYTDSLKKAGMTDEQIDSLQRVKEEEEMSEHVIEGAFEALNR